MPRELPLDPRQLPTLQQRLANLRAQASGLIREINEAERERDLLAARLSQMQKQQRAWESVRTPPSSVHHPLEVQAWNEALNDRGSALDDVARQIAVLDTEIASRTAAHAALSERLRPLGQLVLNCERFLGRPQVVSMGRLPTTGPHAPIAMEAGDAAG